MERPAVAEAFPPRSQAASVPAALPTPTSVSPAPIAAEVSVPLQPRPITQPVPVQRAPQIPQSPQPEILNEARTETAFFTPPPPVRTEARPESAVDARSDRPIEISERPPVVVEVTTYPIPSPPPASAITQPIQINPRPSGLPESRAISYDSEPLPRLDVSLAGQTPGNAPLPRFREGSAPGMTRLQLPEPGVESRKFNPDDFIVPVSEPVSELVAPPLSPYEPHAPQPIAESAPPIVDFPDLEAEFTLPDTELLAAEYLEAKEISYISIPLPNESTPIPLEDLAGFGNEELEPEDYLLEDYGDYESELGEIPPLQYDDPTEPLESLPALGQAEWETPALEIPIAPVETRQEPATKYESPLEPLTFGNPVGEDPTGVSEVSLHEGSFGKLFSQHVEKPTPAFSETASVPIPIQRSVSAKPEFPLPQPIPQESRKSEGDVLDELFGNATVDGDGKRRLSKLEVIMISSIAAVAVISVGVALFVIHLFGGFSTGANGEVADETEKGAETTNAAVAAPLTKDEPSIGSAPAVIDPVAMIRDGNVGDVLVEKEAPTEVIPPRPQSVAGESRALSFDERVQQVVNGQTPNSGGGSVIGSPSLDLVDDAIGQFNSPAPKLAAPVVKEPAPAPPAPASAPTLTAPVTAAPAPGLTAPTAPENRSLGAASGKVTNYNPPAFFPAPGANEGPLVRTNDVIDAFLRAPNWEKKLEYTYQGASLRPAIEDYYKKWPDTSMERFSLQLFQMEQSTDQGGPYWVYLVSANDMEQGFPLILRIEDGNLKVDWEIYSEFYDRHFVRFREGKIPSPGTFRLVLDRVSDYYGTDRDAFTDLNDYQVYQVNAPYGDLDEFSEYVFVKKDTELAQKLDKTVGLGDDPLAVIITLDRKAFAHGVKHFLITDYITEGWFR
ncbi:MAG: hypothetical protein KBF76_13670 [Verrucomicrobiales bacterium]|nr:hypothetical protein [Verrucomicrobiales bacterium]